MRALECDCGHRLEASDDQELTHRFQEHVEQSHPEMQLSDEQIRELVSERAYTPGSEGRGAIDQRGPSGA